MPISRRTALSAAVAFVSAKPASWLSSLALITSAQSTQFKGASMSVNELFPTQSPELVRELVTVAHFNLNRVKEICDPQPALANAAWDWGFGDWETPLGAACHMGNRPMAEYLLSHGAHPSLFSAAFFGQLPLAKSFLAANPGAQKIHGPHSISLFSHARMGGDAARDVLEYLKSLEGSDTDQPAPLSESETNSLLGIYPFGSGESEQVEITLPDPRIFALGKMYTYPPQLLWTRKGTMTRPLFHLGNLKFFPAGSPSTRIEFQITAQSISMQILAPAPLLAATKRTG